MFGWFQRKQDPKQTRAYQLGRDMAERFANDLEKLMEIRFKPWAEGYLDVLQVQLNKCLNPANAPPIIVAKIEYKIFSERVVERHDEMIADVTGVLSEHLAVADQVQMRDKFDELLQVTVGNFCRKLTEDGLQRLFDMGSVLKIADDEWRPAHPELSAKFPADL